MEGLAVVVFWVLEYDGFSLDLGRYYGNGGISFVYDFIKGDGGTMDGMG